METINDLRKLLKHEIVDLMSAEDQIIEAMPAMIKKASKLELKKALQEHLKVTEKQRARLNKVQGFFKEDGKESRQPGTAKGFLSGLFGGGQKCKGMEGLITEGEKVMNEDMSQEVLDAAIIACAQKIEHYEICGYGTAKAYAKELQMPEVARLLDETLNEEYFADNTLTALAVGGGINEEAETADIIEAASSLGKRRNSSPATKGSAGKSSNPKAAQAAAKKAPVKATSAKKTAAKKASAPKKASALRRR
jgi:ferritin-like metal-binding protein YciE